MTKRPDLPVAPLVALLLGVGIGWVDSRPAWDDTGITAVAVFVCAFAAAAGDPRWAWLSGLAVGLPVLALDAVLRGGYGAVAAVGIGLVAAGLGYLAGRFLRSVDPTNRT